MCHRNNHHGSQLVHTVHKNATPWSVSDLVSCCIFHPATQQLLVVVVVVIVVVVVAVTQRVINT